MSDNAGLGQLVTGGPGRAQAVTRVPDHVVDLCAGLFGCDQEDLLYVVVPVSGWWARLLHGLSLGFKRG